MASVTSSSVGFARYCYFKEFRGSRFFHQAAMNRKASNFISISTGRAFVIALQGDEFVDIKDEQDLDSPTPGFASIHEAAEDIRQGKMMKTEKMREIFIMAACKDAKEGTTTGASAKDSSRTVLALASFNSKPEDFNRPDHIFPLKYREGGVLKRAGHTETSVDLTIMAGLSPSAVVCEIVVDDDGSMALLPKLHEFAERENLKIISIADLIMY